MNKIKLAAITAALVVSTSANSALVSRLGGLAYYDTDADLTWLADANAAVGSAYDTWSPGSGRMNWADANAWAADLTVGGVDGWRLTTTEPAIAGPNQTGSEMGNLFYNVLGNSYGLLSSTGPFSNVQSYYYWSGPEYGPNTNYAWYFSMTNGFQNLDVKTPNLYAWAVQSGDVSAVPVPAAVWLFGSGLVGLVGLARRKR